jgi:hypothetical protein
MARREIFDNRRANLQVTLPVISPFNGAPRDF